VEAVRPSARHAKESGILFYLLPEELDLEWIDPLIRKAVGRINESDWVWTAESCQGHPDDTEFRAWSWNTRPMLRLVTTRARYGEMLALLSDAMMDVEYPMSPADPSLGSHVATLGFEVYPHGHSGDYTAVLVYVKATNAHERNMGIVAFERFAEAVCVASRSPFADIAKCAADVHRECPAHVPLGAEGRDIAFSAMEKLLGSMRFIHEYASEHAGIEPQQL
jgi:hypothetical protein